MNENIKNKISKSRIKFLKENPDKHPWKRSTKFKSEPCEHLKQLLKDKSYTFEEEFTDARWNHCYSLDIAFIDKKLAIEVNGNQHYKNDGTLTDYYRLSNFKKVLKTNNTGKIYEENSFNSLCNCSFSIFIL